MSAIPINETLESMRESLIWKCLGSGAEGTPLKFDKYKKYYLKSERPGQWLFKFKNNYGASVVKHFGSYGYYEDLFELAVLYWGNEDDFDLVYDTDIADEVIGYLSNDRVMDYLEKIKNLDKKGRLKKNDRRRKESDRKH